MTEIVEGDVTVQGKFGAVITLPLGTVINSIESADGEALINCFVSYDYSPFMDGHAEEFEFLADEIVVSTNLEYQPTSEVVYISYPDGRGARRYRKK